MKYVISLLILAIMGIQLNALNSNYGYEQSGEVIRDLVKDVNDKMVRNEDQLKGMQIEKASLALQLEQLVRSLDNATNDEDKEDLKADIVKVWGQMNQLDLEAATKLEYVLVSIRPKLKTLEAELNRQHLMGKANWQDFSEMRTGQAKMLQTAINTIRSIEKNLSTENAKEQIQSIQSSIQELYHALAQVDEDNTSSGSEIQQMITVFDDTIARMHNVKIVLAREKVAIKSVSYQKIVEITMKLLTSGALANLIDAPSHFHEGIENRMNIKRIVTQDNQKPEYESKLYHNSYNDAVLDSISAGVFRWTKN